MKVPRLEECVLLQNEYGMFSNVADHCVKVWSIARYVASKLIKNGHDIDMALLQGGALLHDITKTHHIVAKGFYIKSKDESRAREYFEGRKHLLTTKSFEEINDQWEDMKKTLDVDYFSGHPDTGGKLVTHLGYPELGELVAQHNQPLTDISTASVLCYSDRVVGRRDDRNVVVSVDERFKYVLRKYGDKWVNLLKEPTLELEKKLLGAAGIEFENLLEI